MRRREFVRFLASGAAVQLVAGAASGQEAGRSYRLACLVQAHRNAPHWIAFFEELRKNGFVEGVNLSIVDGFNTPLNRAEITATALVNARPDAIMTAGALTRVVQRATQTIPILTVSDDLLAEQAVASLAHPGGNTTGISILAPELDGKRQEILLEAIPLARRLAILVDPGVTAPHQLDALQDIANAHGITVSTHIAANLDEIMPAIDAALAAGAQALNVLASSLFNRYRAQIIERMAAIRLPAIYQWPETAEEGGLLGYGPRFTQVFRQRARTVVKILRGTRPADLPIEQPTTFELVINLKSAKAIGHEVPASLVLRADKVIE